MFGLNKYFQIVKIECKLYNSDKMHVASLYVDLQRQGLAMPIMEDFMADFMARLNLEAAQNAKNTDNAMSSDTSKGMASEST